MLAGVQGAVERGAGCGCEDGCGAKCRAAGQISERGAPFFICLQATLTKSQEVLVKLRLDISCQASRFFISSGAASARSLVLNTS